MRIKTLKIWCLVHKWTSLVCTAFLLLLCVTGLPLIFHHEIDHLLGGAEPPVMPTDAPRANLDEIVATAQAQRPGDAMQFVSSDEEEPNVWYVGMGETADAPEVTVFYTFDARTAEILDTWTPSDRGVMDIIFSLHYDLFAGLPGTLFLGFMGLLFVVALVSGVVVYGLFMRKLRFGTVRAERSRRTRWLDLHNLLGIAALLWLLVVGVTGVINTLAIPIFGYWQNTELTDMAAPFVKRPPLQDIASVQKAVRAAQEVAPDMRLSFISFPGNDSASPHHYVAYMNGQTPLTSKLLTPLLIDARTSAVIDSRDMPWYVNALLVSQPLHFGDYGGVPLKVLWALLDVIAIIVLGSGLYLWRARHRRPIEEELEELSRQNDLGDAVRDAI